MFLWIRVWLYAIWWVISWTKQPAIIVEHINSITHHQPSTLNSKSGDHGNIVLLRIFTNAYSRSCNLDAHPGWTVKFHSHQVIRIVSSQFIELYCYVIFSFYISRGFSQTGCWRAATESRSLVHKSTFWLFTPGIRSTFGSHQNQLNARAMLPGSVGLNRHFSAHLNNTWIFYL